MTSWIFSKIEAGKLDIERLPMDLRRCVEDVGATDVGAGELQGDRIHCQRGTDRP